MRKLLKEISVIPGVSGTCIYDRQEGAVCTEAEAELARKLSHEVGVHVVRLLQMGAMHQLNIASAQFWFDSHAVVALPLENGAVLLALCEADANCSLVATTAAMLARDMSDELAKGASPAPGGEGGSGSGPDPGALNGRLAVIEEALAEAIGPVAGVVVDDYYGRWCRSGPAEPDRLPELIGLLAGEIGDPGLTAQFIKKVESL